jgi:hypothetical protein
MRLCVYAFMGGGLLIPGLKCTKTKLQPVAFTFMPECVRVLMCLGMCAYLSEDTANITDKSWAHLHVEAKQP